MDRKISLTRVTKLGKVLLLWLLIFSPFAQAGNIKVMKVWPEKLLYGRGEEAKISITLKNEETSKQEGKLVCEIIGDLDTRIEILNREVVLGPKEVKVFSATWNTGKEEYGFEARATFFQDNKQIATGSEYFAVCDNVFKIGQYYSDFYTYNAERWFKEKKIPQNRSHYIMITELNVSPESFGDHTPDTDTWWTQHTCYHESKKGVKTFVEESHKHGMKILIYANHMPAGYTGFEFARQHPEWVLYRRNGMWEAFFDVAQLARIAHMSEEERYKGCPPWMALNLNFYDRKVVNFGCDEIIAGAKMFGYDGVRFDGHYLCPAKENNEIGYDYAGNPETHGEDGEKLSVEIIKHVRNYIRKKLPGFLFGYNYGYEYDYNWSKRPKAFASTCSEGSMLMWESIRSSIWREGSRYSTWKGYIKGIKEEANRVIGLGGYHLIIVDNWVNHSLPAYNHLVAMTFAARSHICYAAGCSICVRGKFGDYMEMNGEFPDGSAAEKWNRFATRYAAFLYDDRLKDVDFPEKILQVKGEREIFWKDYVYWRNLSTDKRQLIIHLINAPVHKKVLKNERKAPPIQHNISVSAKIPSGFTKVRCWVLTPDQGMRGFPISVKIAGRKAMVNIPELEYWDIVVFEFLK